MKHNIIQMTATAGSFDQPNFSVHFRLFGEKVNKVNKQNCHIWGSENPNIIIEKPMHPQWVTVWCGFWYGGIIGPFFFFNEQGAAITVNVERYRYRYEFSFPKIEEDDMDDIWFQQEGATCHSANVIIDLLRTVFENRIISRNSHVNCPPRSCEKARKITLQWKTAGWKWRNT